MNVSSQSQTIFKNTVVGMTFPVKEIIMPETEGSVNHVMPVEREEVLPEHLQELFDRTRPELSAEQTAQVKNILIKFSSIFSRNKDDFGRTSLIKHHINTEGEKPTKQPPRRLPHHAAEYVDKEVQNMVDKGIVEPSSSPWAAGVVLVEKKDGTKRFCVDYRSLNNKTVKDAYPLPRIDDSLDRLEGASWFCTLDLHSGYWQVEMNEADKPKTAFVTRSGLFQFTVMPFGLCNSPATFERLMEVVLAGLNFNVCLVYIDDIIIFGKTFDETLQNLEQVLTKLQLAGLKLKASKCTLFKQEVLFLGYKVSGDGVQTDPAKVAVVEQWPIPIEVSEVRSFVGLCSYYRRFIAGFSSLAKPLFRLTEKGREFKWTSDCQSAFDNLKKCLTSTPVLAHPNFSVPFILDTDASQVGLGAVLSQDIDGTTKVISYASRTLSKSERKYCVTRKELLALVFACKHFRHYLYGHKVIVRTDHSALKWLMSFKDPQGQVARWIELLSTYDLEITHRPGAKHGNADSLSRYPCRQCGYGEKVVQSVTPDTAPDSSSTVQCLQEGDSDLKKVREWLELNDRPEYIQIKHESNVIKSLWSQYKFLEVRDNLLCRRWEGDRKTIYQVLMPMSERKEILRECHDAKTSGHLGVRKTLARVRERFYWPGLQADVRIYVTGCPQCRKRKVRSSGKSHMQIDQTGYPLERVASDIMGPLPETESGNKYIIVVSDYFTKWTEAYPLKNIESQTVAKVLVEQFFCKYGVPEMVHSDQGRQYESRLFKDMCELLGIKKTRTTAFHPKSDGMVERFNKTLATMLSAYVSDYQQDWDKKLPYVLMAYRSSQHESTGYTPNMLMMGRETATPIDIMYELPNRLKPTNVHDWVWELRKTLEEAHANTRKITEQSMLRQKRYHDQNVVKKKFEEGDKVLVYFPQRAVGKSPKLMSFWYGPYIIVKQHSDVTFKIRKETDTKTLVVHVDRLRPYGTQVLRDEGDSESLENHDQVIDAKDLENHDKGNDVTSDDESQVVLLGNSELNEIELAYAGRRQRKRPAWHSDYEFDYKV